MYCWKQYLGAEKIVAVVIKAQRSITDLTQGLGREAAVHVASSIDEYQVNIDQIQKEVENFLMNKNPNVARAYIEYRSERDRIRESNSPLAKSIQGLITLSNKEITNENANKDAKVFPVQRDLLAGIVSKHFAHSGLLPREVIDAHDSGDIHYHDLDYAPFLPMTNCCLVDLKGMLQNGFKLGNAQIESPKSIGVACAIMAQITAQVASHQYGGTTFANIDQVLAPYAEKSFMKWLNVAADWVSGDDDNRQDFARERTVKEIYDGIQAYEYEINTLFTTNGQQPFVTVSFGMGSNWFEKEIQKAILRVRIKGLGKDGLTAVFPKLVFFIEDGLNLKPEDPNYDVKQLALECASKRLYPDIIS